jgi:hypothetical protein
MATHFFTAIQIRVNPVPALLYVTTLRLTCPNKNRAEPPESHELRANSSSAALSPTGLQIKKFLFKFSILEYNFYMEIKCNKNGTSKK